MSKLRQLVDSFGKILSVMGTISLLFIMMYIVCSVGSRFITGKPLLGTFELGSTFLPLIAAFYYVNTALFGIRNHQMMAETSVLGLPTAPFLFIYSFLLLNFSIFMFFKAIDYFGGKTSPDVVELREQF